MGMGLGSDQTGFGLEERLKTRFAAQGHAAEDVSSGDPRKGNCLKIADRLASSIYAGRVERGLLICSGAIGASAVANKRPGVRAALCHELYSAR